jgi:hypothetical protein
MAFGRAASVESMDCRAEGRNCQEVRAIDSCALGVRYVELRTNHHLKLHCTESRTATIGED